MIGYRQKIVVMTAIVLAVITISIAVPALHEVVIFLRWKTCDTLWQGAKPCKAY